MQMQCIICRLIDDILSKYSIYGLIKLHDATNEIMLVDESIATHVHH